MKRTDAKAFTLIELLIVVAIIAILAAIAVPNFLEAQTRAKVTQVKADCRNIATANEIYRVDNKGSLPNGTSSNGDVWPNFFWASRWYYYIALSTPVSYMNGIPQDKFIREYYTRQGWDAARFWEITLYDNNILKAVLVNPDAPSAPGIFNWPRGREICEAAGQNIARDFPYFRRWFTEYGRDGANYAFTPWGPASHFSFGGYNGYSIAVYDPSNGTMSIGNIVSYY